MDIVLKCLNIEKDLETNNEVIECRLVENQPKIQPKPAKLVKKKKSEIVWLLGDPGDPL